MYKIFLILRYLSKKTLILLSMGGVTVAVGVFIVVFSVLDGFGQNIERRLRGTISDIVVSDISGDGLTDYEEIIAEARKQNPNIVACAPFIERIAMFQEYEEMKQPDAGGKLAQVSLRRSSLGYGLIRGIDPARELRVGRLDEFLRDGGYYDLHPRTPLTDLLKPGSMNVMTGAQGPGLAFAAGGPYAFFDLRTNERVKPEGATFDEQVAYMTKHYGAMNFIVYENGLVIYSAVTGRPVPTNQGKFHVAGVFKTWGSEYDSHLVYMNIKDAQDLLKMSKAAIDRSTGERTWRPAVSGISVKLNSYSNLESAKKTLQAVLKKYGANCSVKGWTEVRKSMLDALVVEKAVAVTILTCIVLVMGFGIFAILSISSAQKGRDIGVLKAIGATDGGILTVFLSTGLSVGIVGSILGTALGILVASSVNEIQAFLSNLIGWELFPKDVFYFDKIPSQIHAAVYLAIAGVTLAVCLVASIAPALMAARRDPTKTLVV